MAMLMVQGEWALRSPIAPASVGATTSNRGISCGQQQPKPGGCEADEQTVTKDLQPQV
jgi:hypothetical protein